MLKSLPDIAIIEAIKDCIDGEQIYNIIKKDTVFRQASFLGKLNYLNHIPSPITKKSLVWGYLLTNLFSIFPAIYPFVMNPVVLTFITKGFKSGVAQAIAYSFLMKRFQKLRERTFNTLNNWAKSGFRNPEILEQKVIQTVKGSFNKMQDFGLNAECLNHLQETLSVECSYLPYTSRSEYLDNMAGYTFNYDTELETSPIYINMNYSSSAAQAFLGMAIHESTHAIDNSIEIFLSDSGNKYKNDLTKLEDFKAKLEKDLPKVFTTLEGADPNSTKLCEKHATLNELKYFLSKDADVQAYFNIKGEVPMKYFKDIPTSLLEEKLIYLFFGCAFSTMYMHDYYRSFESLEEQKQQTLELLKELLSNTY